MFEMLPTNFNLTSKFVHENSTTNNEWNVFKTTLLHIWEVNGVNKTKHKWSCQKRLSQLSAPFVGHNLDQYQFVETRVTLHVTLFNKCWAIPWAWEFQHMYFMINVHIFSQHRVYCKDRGMQVSISFSLIFFLLYG